MFGAALRIHQDQGSSHSRVNVVTVDLHDLATARAISPIPAVLFKPCLRVGDCVFRTRYMQRHYVVTFSLDIECLVKDINIFTSVSMWLTQRQRDEMAINVERLR
jgi:hypothetical protein